MNLEERRKISSALNVDRKDESFTFAWGRQLHDQEVTDLSMLLDPGQPTDPRPISAEHLEGLAGQMHPAICGQGLNVAPDLLKETGQMDRPATKSHRSCALASYLALLAANGLLGGNSLEGFTVEAHMDRLLLLTKGGRVKSHRVSENQPGMFAAMVLQIPVEGGHEGGRLKVQQPGRNRAFDSQKESHRRFYLSAFLSDCHFEIEPVTDGAMLLLFFNLVWKDAFQVAESPLDLLVYLNALRVIQPILRKWIERFDQREGSESSVSCSVPASEPGPCTPEKMGENSIHTKCSTVQDFTAYNRLMMDIVGPEYAKVVGIDCPLSSIESPDSPERAVVSDGEDEGRCSGSESTDEETDNEKTETELIGRLPQVESQTEFPLLVIPLERRYSEDVRFTGLKGRDRLIAHILRSIGFVQVYLATMDQRIGETACCHPDWKEECHCPLDRHFLIDRWTDEYNTSSELDEDLMVDVRSQLVGSLYDLLAPAGRPARDNGGRWLHHSVLVVWPRDQSIRIRCRYQFDRLLEDLENQPHVNALSQMVAYCKRHPLRVWSGHAKKDGDRTLRLLRLCTHLRAKREGLELLDLMATDFPIDPTVVDSRRTGFRDVFFVGIGSKHASAIAEFECRVTGWSDCADVILRLVSPVRFSQWSYFLSLVRHLKFRNCSEGAKLVADEIAHLLPHVDIADPLTTPRTRALLELAFWLEADPATASAERMARLSEFLPRLSLRQLCDLSVHFLVQGRLRYSASPATLQVFDDLARLAVSGDFTTVVPVSPSFLHLLVERYVQLGDRDLLEQLTTNICSCSAVLKILLSSRRILELDAPILKTLVKAHISFLMNGVAPEARHVTSAFRLALRMENKTELADAERIALLSTLFNVLPHERKCRLLSDLHQSDPNRWKQSPTVFNMFAELCGLLVQPDVPEGVPLPGGLFTKTLELLAWLGDVSLLSAFARRFSSDQPDDDAGAAEVIEQVIAKFSGQSSSDTVAMTSLLDAWISVLAPTTIQSKAFGAKTLELVLLAMQAEQNRADLDPPMKLATTFAPLVSQLSGETLGGLLLDVRTKAATLKEHPTCLQLYRQLCRSFASRDVVGLVARNNELAVNVMKCLVWLDDAESLTAYAFQIAAAFPTGESVLLWDVLSTPEVRLAAESSIHARTAYILILDERIRRLSEFHSRYQQPNASMPDHPLVEAFLRSTSNSMTYNFNYENFGDFNGAALFACRLARDCLLNGHLVTTCTKMSGPHCVTCEIVKIIPVDPEEKAFEYPLLQNEIEVLQNVRKTLVANHGLNGSPNHLDASATKSEGEGIPVKKIKLDASYDNSEF